MKVYRHVNRRARPDEEALAARTKRAEQLAAEQHPGCETRIHTLYDGRYYAEVKRPGAKGADVVAVIGA